MNKKADTEEIIKIVMLAILFGVLLFGVYYLVKFLTSM